MQGLFLEFWLRFLFHSQDLKTWAFNHMSQICFKGIICVWFTTETDPFAELLVGKIHEEQYKELRASCRWSQPSLFLLRGTFYTGLCSCSSKSTCFISVPCTLRAHCWALRCVWQQRGDQQLSPHCQQRLLQVSLEPRHLQPHWTPWSQREQPCSHPTDRDLQLDTTQTSTS